MDGLECSEIYLSKIENSFTIGSEYYSKNYVNALNKVLACAECKTLKELSFLLTDGDHGAPEYQESGVLYLLSENIHAGYIDTTKCKYITLKKNRELQRSCLHPGDIVVTKTGVYFGKSAVIPESISEANTIAHVGKITLKPNHNPYYVSTFLNSEYGYSQLRRRGIKATRPEIKLIEFSDIVIPIFSTGFNDCVERTVRQAINFMEMSSCTIGHAEKVLLSELGIMDFSPTDETVAVKNLSQSFGETGRLDAEYYQPKYEFYESKIKNYCGGYNKLGDICKYIFTGEYADEYLRKSKNLQFYIRGTNMKNGRIEKDDNYYVHPGSFTKKVCSGDIVTTRVGTIGTFAEIDDNLDGAVCSDNVICFRMPDECRADVYTLLFNSKPVYEIIDRLARGSVQQRLNQETLRQIIVPMLDLDLQRKISEIIQSSFELRNKSRLLLDCAVKAVELAIEKSEEKATAWLDEKIKEIESL